MSYVRYLVVLIAAFLLVIPAFSIPDDGRSTGYSDNRQKISENQNSMMGSDGHQQIGPRSMMGNDGSKIVCLTICKVIDSGGQNQAAPRSMMGGDGQDGRDKTCGCQNSLKGQGQDGRQSTCGCQAGQEHAEPRSMMGDKGQDGWQGSCNDGQQKACGCQAEQEQMRPRSMMGNDDSKIVCLCKVVSGGQEQTASRSMTGGYGQDGQRSSWNPSQKSWNGDSKQDGQGNTDYYR